MQAVEGEKTGESPAPSAQDISSSLAQQAPRAQRATSSMLTVGARSGAAAAAAAAGPSNLGRPAAARRERSGLEGVSGLRGPSARTAAPSSSVMSGGCPCLTRLAMLA